MRNLEDYFFWIVAALIVALVAWGVYASVEQANQWVDDCVADGNKRYECEERWSKAHPPAPQTNVTVHSGH